MIPPVARFRASVVWAPLPARTALQIGGADAVRFVDNFVTASVARVPVGGGTEAFVADGRGQVIALVNLLRTDAGLWIDAAPGLAPQLAAHLEHYHIREDVSFHDASAERATVFVGGSAAAAWLADRAAAPPTAVLSHAAAVLDGVPVVVVATDWWGPGGFLVQCAAADASRLAAVLAADGSARASDAELEAARIEAGSPMPNDIPPKTLPQELGRDARAICFTKGCYLGQETVARLDALGHVNRRLVGVATAGVPAVGAEVTCGGAAVGVITSSCQSSATGGWLSLALVHSKALAADAAPQVAGGPARIVALPGSERHGS